MNWCRADYFENFFTTILDVVFVVTTIDVLTMDVSMYFANGTVLRAPLVGLELCFMALFRVRDTPLELETHR